MLVHDRAQTAFPVPDRDQFVKRQKPLHYGYLLSRPLRQRLDLGFLRLTTSLGFFLAILGPLEAKGE